MAISALFLHQDIEFVDQGISIHSYTVHSAVATNNVMVRRNREISGLCPCYGRKPETQHHLITECEELNKTRNEMARNI